LYNGLIKSISNSYRYPLRNLNSLLTKLFHLPSKYIKYAHTILYIRLHVPFHCTACPRVLRAGFAPGLHSVFPSGTALYVPSSMGARLPLAWGINCLYGHLVPWALSAGIALSWSLSLSGSAAHQGTEGWLWGSEGLQVTGGSECADEECMRGRISPFTPICRLFKLALQLGPGASWILLRFQAPRSSAVPRFSITALHP